MVDKIDVVGMWRLNRSKVMRIDGSYRNFDLRLTGEVLDHVINPGGGGINMKPPIRHFDNDPTINRAARSPTSAARNNAPLGRLSKLSSQTSYDIP